LTPRSFVLRLLVRESLAGRNVFPKLPPDHLLRDQYILIILPVVDGEPQTDEVGENGCAALLRLDRRGVRRRGKLAGEREAADD
jgi:hypothetical protein